MKVGICQMDIVWENEQQNMKKALTFLEQAKEAGDDLIIFPEMCMTGFSMEPWHFARERKDSEVVAFFKEQAKKEHIAVAFGIAEKKGNQYYNKLLVTDKTGELIADYTKIHPFSYAGEEQYFEKGSELQFFSVEDCLCSGFICYDLRFPELFMEAARKAEVLFVCANWPAGRREHWKVLLQARAVETQSYMIGVNRTGEGNGLTYTGDSMIIAPDGSILAGPVEGEEMLHATLRKEEVSKQRSSFPIRNDRRPDLYEKFYTGE